MLFDDINGLSAILEIGYVTDGETDRIIVITYALHDRVNYSD